MSDEWCVMKPETQRGKVGLFGIGLAAYWPQFKGLKRRLEGYQRIVNRWCMEGPTHHCALGVGHVLSVARRIAALLKLPHVEIG
jgi:L-arabinose isomerase